MNALALALALSPLALLPAGAAPEGAERSSTEGPTVDLTGSGEGVRRGGPTQYALIWDDSLDGTLDSGRKACRVELQRIDGTVTGRFVGTVLGEERTATFTGEAAGSLLMLQQREPGYVCSYQLTATGVERWGGTWRDSEGRDGTVVLAPVLHGPLH